jgi:hypothetical protein
MADWTTIASLGTAAGTLVLAAATFSAVRSSNRSARLAERSLLVGMRPVLVQSRPDDPLERVLFAELQWFEVEGGHATVEISNDVIYMLMGVRNVGTGLAVLRSWRARPRLIRNDDGRPAPLESFHTQVRDIYIPAGDTGIWQGAIRDPDDPDREALLDAITNREGLTIELHYGDGEGGQRVVSRFALIPTDDVWLVSTTKHWNLDRDDPR